MTSPVLVLRPQPGADETARRAIAIGLEPVVAPLFAIHPRAWRAPDPGRFDAVMLTSANAARLAGEALGDFLRLPAYAVGETTAAAARAAGFVDVRAGPADAAALAAWIAADGRRSVFHPCGEDRVAIPKAPFELLSLPVYAAEPVATLPAAAADALDRGAIALLHSPRAAALFARLAPRPDRTRIAAISPAAAAAAGDGWLSVTVAERPRDQALLELAAKLCQTAA